jgi:hypothetical protein
MMSQRVFLGEIRLGLLLSSTDVDSEEGLQDVPGSFAVTMSTKIL